ENTQGMRLLLRASMSTTKLKFWIGDDLTPYTTPHSECSVLTIPYYVNQACVGAVGLLGPKRIPYRKLFGLLRQFSYSVSEALTRNLYKYKVSFRQPEKGTLYLQKEEHHFIEKSNPMLL